MNPHKLNRSTGPLLAGLGLLVASVAPALAQKPPEARDTLSLAGKWEFALDPNGAGVKEGWASRTLPDSIDLPNTTDVARKGKFQEPTEEAWKLTRRYPYEGLAWYRKTFTVPQEWKGKEVAIYLERTKKVTVYLDGGAPRDGGRQLSTSHLIRLGKLSPGVHTLAILIDNRLSNWPDRVVNSHMLDEATQTNWNGILGRIELQTEELFAIQGVSVGAVPGDPHRLRIHVHMADPAAKPVVTAYAGRGGDIVEMPTVTGTEIEFQTGPATRLWDEYHPNLLRLMLEAKVEGVTAFWEGRLGLRDFRAQDGHFTINGRRVFLRGKHDGCVFPLTAHPPMDEAGWEKYFATVQAYGLNHVRFHSWCPPEAAFAVADRLGIYLQPELPFWGDPAKPGVEAFLNEEGRRILIEYGHHPSFVMLSIGNEYWGDSTPRPRMVAALRAFDPSRLYDQGSNSEAWNPHEFAGDDYRVSAYGKPGLDGKARGSYAHQDKKDGEVGYIQEGAPGTSKTYTIALAGKRLPFINHEVGQYQVFPNFREAAKYTGALRADNFAVFEERLKKAGLLDQAEDFRRASGMLSALAYREEIEAALRTPDMDGFHLLDLQDYPGQGTALVGMLDAFMDSKGIVTPEEWRAFCSPVVPLALFAKHTWTDREGFSAEIRVANYSEAALSSPVEWQMKEGSRVLGSGTVGQLAMPAGSVTTLGWINVALRTVEAPARLALSVSIGGHALEWPLWVYPAEPSKPLPGVSVARTVDDALAHLARGERVLLLPKAQEASNSLPGYFTPDFWCYPMFKKGNPPGTLGLLIQDRHPALAAFPTRFYSEWQWQSLAHHSQAVILDSLAGYRPIVQPIDNVERNHRLGTIFELKVGAGRLLVCAIDLPAMPEAPEAAQLLLSLEQYAQSPKFAPAREISPEALRKLLRGE
ncbi:MAG: sugar-binding domain-containing protein [Bryobacteraceae bacterium]